MRVHPAASDEKLPLPSATALPLDAPEGRASSLLRDEDALRDELGLDGDEAAAFADAGFAKALGVLGYVFPLVFVALAALLVGLGVNAAQLYDLSRRRRPAWEARIVDTWAAAGFNVAGGPLQTDTHGAVDARSSDYDYARSDNYKYKGRLLAYDHERAAVLAGAALFFALAAWSLLVAGRMTAGWRRFYAPTGRRRGAAAWRPRSASVAMALGCLEAGNHVETGMIALVVGLALVVGRGAGPAAVFGLAASGVVVVMHLVSKRSRAAQMVVYESLEICVQSYQALRWSGVDPVELLLRGRASPSYHDLAAGSAVRGAK